MALSLDDLIDYLSDIHVYHGAIYMVVGSSFKVWHNFGIIQKELLWLFAIGQFDTGKDVI